ncbi:trace amine-associated receptor 1-like [Polypterus senegalus]|uniref:trace amine-associated receptor 1-like n=1 Tax=Polypterus senegalus TaxID=55291 RepID=UPI0019634685|nr:trace amine-associated receptor 1-like [Polypterus senegalus]
MNDNQSGILKATQFCYTSVENSCPKQEHSITAHVLMYMTLWTITTVTLCGNLLVIICISHFKQLHTPTNFLTLSLAAVDFLLGVLIMPPSMIRTVESCWYFGDFFCKFHTSTDIMLCSNAILHLFFISVDRYYAVCCPLRYNSRITLALISKIIFISWFLSFMFGFSILFLRTNIKGIENFYEQAIFCIGSCTFIQNQVSGLVATLLSFYIPGFIMVVIYLKIFIVAKRQVRSLKKVAEDRKKTAVRKRETKAAKTLSIVVGVFLTCWLPFFLSSSIDLYMNYSTPALVAEILIWFAYLNSTFNPLIYAFFYTWFRKAVRVIILGELFKSNSSLTKLYTE